MTTQEYFLNVFLQVTYGHHEVRFRGILYR